ncbi:CREB-regulated transcription coactivator 2 isoform X2 [Trichomycterus rosablanca]|uniref:CREB-regulated transcription coactivator 2 isoform X2 n=1 Tax=Trichomycterus rosablanca TaxID=2290929 RepID=UPI002F34F1AF
MSAVGAGACGPGPGAGGAPGSGIANPRKFSEKIALHTQRQAEETAAFQEVMMDITSTRLQAQKVRLARIQGPYYGGSLPNVNQIGRNAPDLQVPFHAGLDSSRSTRHNGLVARALRDQRFASPSRPYRRQMDSSHCSSAYLSPPPDPSWRRTNSDSALHTSVMNPPSGDPFGAGHAVNLHGRCSGLNEGEGRRMFPYPVPPIEEIVLDEDRLLKPWDTKKMHMLSSRPKSCEVPGITILPSPDQQSGGPHIPMVLNTGGSLPDLSSLHFPSPLPTPLDTDEPGYPSLSGGNSTGNLASTLTQLGIDTANAFHSPGLLASLQGTLSNPTLQSSLSNPNIQSSLSNPNIQSSLSNHSFPGSLSSASLQSSLSNPSLQSSFSSSPSLQSSLSNQSLHSSLSNSSLSGQPHPSAGGSAACPYGSLLPGQMQPQMSSSPRRRGQLTPLNMPLGPEARRHHSKQFSPTVSTTLTSITQGVPLDTSRMMMDQRLPPYPFSQSQQIQHSDPQTGCTSPQSGHPPVQPPQCHPHTHTHRPQAALQHVQNMQNLHKTQNFPYEQVQQHHQHPCSRIPPLQQNHKPGGTTDLPGSVHSQIKQEADMSQNTHQEQNQNIPQFQNVSQAFTGDLGLYNDSLLLNSLLDDPYLSLQFPGKQSQTLCQQFNVDSQVEGVSFNHNLGSSVPNKAQDGTYPGHQGVLELLESTEHQFLNATQNQNYGSGRLTVPNIILTGDSPPGLSKEITSALSGVPGFEVDPFSSDDSLALDGLGMLADGDLMLADPSVEDSFRFRLK